MSKSYREPWIKDKNNFNYNKLIRSRINSVVRQLKYDPELRLPLAKELINDYDVCDFKFMAFSNVEKYKRK